MGLTGWRRRAGTVVVVVVVVVVDGASVVFMMTGLRAGVSFGTWECVWGEYPLGTLEYEAMKPSEVTLWSDTNWTRRMLLLVKMGLGMEVQEKKNRTWIELRSSKIGSNCI